MMEAAALLDLFDSVPTVTLSGETKASCQKISDYFGELIHKEEENIFSIMASGKNQCFSNALKMSIPGEQVCAKIEQIRQSLFSGVSPEITAELYFDTIQETFDYIDFLEITEKISGEDAVEAAIAFYETYGIRCFAVNDQLYKDVKNGISESFRPFFQEYLTQYREQMKDVMLMGSFGAERNYNASYRKTTYKYIELLLCYGVIYAYHGELSSDSYQRFAKRLTPDIVRDPEAFYQLWYTLNNEVIEEAFSKEEFSDLLFDFANIYNELLAESKKMYETNLGCAPVARESDMRELYKTVYELRKELDEVKKELRGIKGC